MNERSGGPGRRVVDFHNHVIPGVDDGARDPGEALAALEAMMAGGVVALIATPHLHASLARWPDQLQARLDELDAGWTELRRQAQRLARPPRLERGAEIRLDTPDPDLTDPRTRLGGGRFALVEFSYFTVPPRSETVLDVLGRQDVVPVIAHPERYRNLHERFEVVRSWRDAGAYLQVNGGSLIGRYGDGPRELALQLIRRGWADYVSSDYHARGQTGIDEYAAVLLRVAGPERTELLLHGNAVRLLAGDPPEPVPALPDRPGLFERMLRAFRRDAADSQTPSGRAAAPRSTHSRK